MNEDKKYLTVSAINKYIAYKIDTDMALKSLYVKGELSNVRVSKGHIYLVLKDDESEISGIVFYNIASKLTFMPKDGMKVLIHGSINSYSKKGSYNLIIDKIEEYGEGLIYQEFLKLKEKLQNEGLFDVAHKKKIPEFNFNIGVITSATADAFFDIVSTINKRFPLCTIKLFPSLVQGADAPNALISALLKADKENMDVLIIARGGGSFEDLNCFNDEKLARVIYNLNTPIVSGVGHEQDYTIVDFVCDGRAPTPTGAATMVTNDRFVLLKNIDLFNNKLFLNYQSKIREFEKKYLEEVNKYGFRNFINILDTQINYIDLLKNKLESLSPTSKLELKYDNVLSLEKRLYIYNLNDKLEKSKESIVDIENKINNLLKASIYNNEKELDFIISKMIDVNPLNIMKKGYAVVYNKDKVIISKNEVNNDDILTVKFHDGEIDTKVIKK